MITIQKITYPIIVLLLWSSTILWSCKTDNNNNKQPPELPSEVIGDTTAGVVDTIVEKLDAFAADVEANIANYKKDPTTTGNCTTTYFDIGEDKVIHKITTTCIREGRTTKWKYYKLGTTHQLVEYEELIEGEEASNRYRKVYLVNRPNKSELEFHKVVDEKGNRPKKEKLEDWIAIVEGGLSSQ